MYSVYKVDYRGAAAPKNTAAQSLKVINCFRALYVEYYDSERVKTTIFFSDGERR